VRARTLLVLSCSLVPAVASVVGLGCTAVAHHLLERQESDAYGIDALAFSPDGSRLLSGGGCDHVKLWRCDPLALRFGLRRPEWSAGPSLAEVRHAVREFGEKPGWIDLVAWSPDGRLALVTQAFGAVRLLDMTGTVPRTLWERAFPDERKHGAVFLGAGGPILLGASDGTAILDLATGATIGTLPLSGPMVLGDRHTLLVATRTAELARIDLTRGELSVSCIAGEWGLNSESISLVGRSRCLVCSPFGIRLHEIATGSTLRELSSKIHFPRAFSSPDGRVAIIVEQGDPCGMGPGFGDLTEVLDVSAGTSRPFPCSLLGGARPVIAAFSPNGETVAIGTNEGRIVLVPVARIAPG